MFTRYCSTSDILGIIQQSKNPNANTHKSHARSGNWHSRISMLLIGDKNIPKMKELKMKLVQLSGFL